MEDPATFLLWGTEISMSHALGKGESPFLREFSFAEGQFRLTESEKKEKRKKKCEGLDEYIPLPGKTGEIPRSGCSFPGLLLLFVSHCLFIIGE